MKQETGSMAGMSLVVASSVIMTGGAAAWCYYQKWQLEQASAIDADLDAIEQYGNAILILGAACVLICILMVPDLYRYWDGLLKQARARKRIMPAEKLQKVKMAAEPRTTVRPPPRRSSAV